MKDHTKTPKYYGKLAKTGLVWGAVRQGGNTLLLIPTGMVLARLLSPQEAGTAAAVTFFTQLAARLTQFGLGAALVRAKQITREHVASVFVMNLALGLSAWATLTMAAPSAGAFFHSRDVGAALRIAAFEFIISGFSSVPTSLLSRDMRYRESSTSDWLSTIAQSGAAVLFAWRGFSFWSLVYASLIGDATRALCRIWMTRWVPSFRMSRAALGDMLSFGTGIYVRNLLDYCAQNVDNLIVGRVLGVSSLGFYDKAYSGMSRFVAYINLSGPSVSFRVFALLDGEPERFRRAYRKVMLTVTLVGFPVLSSMLLLAPEVIEVLFGRRWMPAAVPFQLLCGAGMLRLLNAYASSATQAKGRIWSEVKRQAMFTAALAAAVWVFSGRWGISGAAAGVLLATALITVLLQSLVKRLASLRWRDVLGPLLPGCTCVVVLVPILVLTRAAIHTFLPNAPALLVLAVSGAVASISYIAFLLLAPFSEVRSIVHETLEDFAPNLAIRLRWLTRAPEENLPSLSA